MEKFEELLAAYVAAVKGVAFWSNNGTWGDGKLDAAKRERKRAKRELNVYVRRMFEGGN